MADNNTTFDDSIPVTFTLPDGDQAKLITWAFVMKKLNSELSPIIEQLSETNAALTRINARVDEWLEEQS